MRLPKLTRILSLSALIGLFVLSLQSLQLRYIELPALRQAAKNVIEKKVAEGNAIINKLNDGILKMASEEATLQKNLEASDAHVSQLQLSLMTSKGNEQKALADTKAATDIAVADEIAMKETQDAATAMAKIVQTKFMPVDQCVVFKKPPCMNGHDEMKDTQDDSVCDF